MQAIMETLFDIVYLTLVITVGIRMMIKGRKEKQYFLFGVLAVILGTGLSACICLLAASRIVRCLFPQNEWTSADAPLSWGIYRNIPFVLLGALIIVLFYKKAHETNDRAFRFL